MKMTLSDIKTEKAVLSGIVQYGFNGFIEVSDLLTVESFSYNAYKIIYKCLDYIFKNSEPENVDYPSVISAANSLGLDKAVQSFEKEELKPLFNFSINKSSIRKLAGKIKKLEVARGLLNSLEIAKNELGTTTGDESISEILAKAENPISEYTSLLVNTTDGPISIGDGLDAYIDHLVNQPIHQIGIATCFPRYDKAIGGGLRRKTINLIGARSKQGKSFLVDNIAIHITKNGIPVLNLDTEMGIEDHWNRILANLSNISIDDIESGKFKDNLFNRNKIIEAKEILKKLPYTYISVAGMPFEEIISIMKRWIKVNVGYEDNGLCKPCVIMYDYLKLMSADGLQNMQEYQALGFQISHLHNFMVKTGAACLALIQLNRDGNTKEDTSVISQSDRILWLCSNFSIYKPKTDEETAENPTAGNRKMVIMACRHGAGLDEHDYINFKFDGSKGRIIEGRTRNELRSEKLLTNDEDESDE